MKADSGKILFGFSGGGRGLGHPVAFTQDSRVLAAQPIFLTFRLDLYDAATGKALGALRTPTGHVTAADVLLADAPHVEANVVTRGRLFHHLVVHLDGLDLAGLVRGLKGNLHSCLHGAGFYTTYRHGPDACDGVDILNRHPERLICRFRGH